MIMPAYSLNIIQPLWRNISSTLQNVAAGVDHELHDGLEDEGECGHRDEHRDEGLEELHQGSIFYLGALDIGILDIGI